MQLYPVFNGAYPYMDLEDQESAGVCDWVAMDSEGRFFFGKTREKALRAAEMQSVSKPIELVCV